MPVNLSIKEVPEALAERLRARAQRNHRSLQRELMSIVEAAVAEPAPNVFAPIVSTQHFAADPAARPSHAEWFAASPRDGTAGSAGGLLSELDAIVAHSQWGAAPLLTREQAHDRRLQRELDFESRNAAATARP